MKKGLKGVGEGGWLSFHLACQLLKQLLQPQLHGIAGDLWEGQFSYGQEDAHPAPSCPLAGQPHTWRACRSALITSSISLQIGEGKWRRGLLSLLLGLGRV